MSSRREVELGKKYENRWDSDTDYLISDYIETKLLQMGRRLTDMRFIVKDYGLLLVVRVGKSSEGPMVAFYGGKTAGECVRRCADNIADGGSKFKLDDWEIKKLAEKLE